MAAKKVDDQYPPGEAQQRFEAALRGARVAGHKPMTDIPSKKREASEPTSRLSSRKKSGDNRKPK